MKRASGRVLPVAASVVLLIASGTGGAVAAQKGNADLAEPAASSQVEKSRHQQAVSNIERLGGRLRRETSQDGVEYTEVGLFGGNSFYGWRGDNEDLGSLKQLSNLKRLSIKEVVRFDDEGMRRLEGIDSLDSLFIAGTSISDDGLKYLKGLPELSTLWLWSNSRLTDKALEYIKDLGRLNALGLDDAQISDEGLGKLKGSGLLARLEFLSVNRTAVTDGGLLHLAGSDRLKELYLAGTRVSNEGLEHLARLEKLEVLVLDDTSVSDEGVAHLKGLENLKVLHLRNTQVGDGAIDHLKDLGNLGLLWLGGTQVTDAGLAGLENLTKLRSLDLTLTQVTDKGLGNLKGLGDLRELSLRQTDVTRGGYTQLQRTLLNCRIAWEPRPPVVVGKRPPPISIEQLLQAPEGAKADWKSLAGKVVVLEFWATWCSPCLVSIPHINELSDKFKAEPVQFIAVTNESSSVVQSFLRQRPVRGWIGLDTDNSMIQDFGVGSIPRTVVVGRKGTVRAVTAPAMLTEEFLNELLRK
ncbi:MAG TPA: redoxin family protein [Planctomycetes bacterium]|nr:redoxin family protein [Planctomycetota bacterium]HIJ72404.1 redoxin family protein [Planctomycetota bacterium]